MYITPCIINVCNNTLSLETPLLANSGVVTYFGLASSRTIFLAMLEGSRYKWASTDIYITRYVDREYTQPKKVVSTIDIAYVDPSERFMIFSSSKSSGYGSCDLSVSNNSKDGLCEDLQIFSSKMNSGGKDEEFPITPEGEFTFFIILKAISFSSYWIDTNGVDALAYL